MCMCRSFNGHTYWFCLPRATQQDARANCSSIGMDLTRVDDAAEDAWLFATMQADGLMAVESYVMIGASDLAQAGVWTWPDGTQFWSGDSTGGPVGGLYNHWAANQPTGGQRRCAGVIASGEWVNSSCTNIAPYVCEGL
jgi:hypothetical protein